MIDLPHLQSVLSKSPALRVCVMGDFFLDLYHETAPELAEDSLETGLKAHQVTEVTSSAGAAGTVVNNLRALGVEQLTAIGLIGDDGNGLELRRRLEEADCDTRFLLSSRAWMTPTYLKPRDRDRPGLSGEHSRYDIKNRCPVPASLQVAVIEAFESSVDQMDAVIVVDQITEEEGGIVTTRVRDAICDVARHSPDCHFLADSRFNVGKYRHITIKPNLQEASRFLDGGEPCRPDADEFSSRLLELRRQVEAPIVCTMSDRGVTVVDQDCRTIPAPTLAEEIDPTGAGDSFSAGFTIARAAGATLVESAWVGVLVAGVTIRKLGRTGTATPAEVFKEHARWSRRPFPDGPGVVDG